MKLTVFLSMPALLGIILGSAAGVAVVLVLLYFFVFSRLRLKKEVEELSKTFEYFHALLNAQDSQYIKRIEMISLTNLLYVDVYQNFIKRFKEIRDKFDTPCQTVIFRLKDYLDEKNFKELKASIPEAKEKLNAYKDEATKLHEDLLEKIRPEEQYKQESLELKEKLRVIKQDYYSKEADLRMMNESFEKVFALIDKNFASFDEFINGAKYDEAKGILPKIGSVIVSLGKSLEVLPNLCITYEKVIPEKISYINDVYQTLSKDGYPLNHLHFNQTMMEIDSSMETIGKRMKNFDLTDIHTELDEIICRIDEFDQNFNKEKEAREIFESECDGIYLSNANIEKKYIKLCNALPDVKKIYVLPSDEQAKIDNIKILINKAGATKRSLDTFIHSGVKQPFTTLVEKMHSLQDESSQASKAIDEFDEYLFSLKNDCEATLKNIKYYYAELKNCECFIRKINIAAITEKYMPTIDDLYNNIDASYKLLHSMPIDVNKVNALAVELKEKGDALIQNVKDDYEKMLLCESSIVYGNRHRYGAPELNSYLVNSEQLFFAGDFEKCYEDTKTNIKRIYGVE